MFVLGLAICLRRIDTEVNREEVTCFPAGVEKVDHSNAAHQTTFSSAILKLDQLDLLRILLVLDTVIYDQITLGTVVEQGLHDFPETAGREFLTAQVVANGIVTGGGFPFEMIGKVSAGIVARGSHQIFNVLLLRHNRLYAKSQAKVLIRYLRV